MDLWNTAKSLVSTTASGAVQDLAGAAQQAAQERLSNEVNKLFETDLKIVADARPQSAPVNPELAKVKTVATDAAPQGGFPAWAIPAAVAVVVVLAVVAFIGSRGKKRKGK